MGTRLVILGCLLLTAVALPIYRKRQDARHRSDCTTNLKNMGTALEMYSTDFAGRYPTSVDRLVPNYLKVLPTCPTNGSNYRVATASNPDLYTLVCRGYHR